MKNIDRMQEMSKRGMLGYMLRGRTKCDICHKNPATCSGSECLEGIVDYLEAEENEKKFRRLKNEK